ncbi:response regulator transcription factor [Brevibacillus nitrificans]|uniref:response regulator transcription factor n=1 Tax=Brevibacillus nitrificans TaxID=651560 RepID=UPI00261C9347|nr:response regulator transcription factor [Brevibacillus nitrificans]MED1795345.1 response regulator transcription factor [Brevibacillus nitrificans]
MVYQQVQIKEKGHRAMMNKTVLIVEDEQKLREVITLFLHGDGLQVLEAETGEQAMKIFSECSVDLVILDIMLPNMSGFDVCERIRKNSDVPILFLTALGDDDYYTLGYRLGADDYIVKPFKASILALKVRRIFERQAKADPVKITAKGIELDIDGFRCLIDGMNIELTQKEFHLLQILMLNEGRTMTRDYLLNAVWGYDFYNESRVVDNHIKNLRRKLGTYSTYIKTVISVGYKYEKNI